MSGTSGACTNGAGWTLGTLSDQGGTVGAVFDSSDVLFRSSENRIFCTLSVGRLRRTNSRTSSKDGPLEVHQGRGLRSPILRSSLALPQPTFLTTGARLLAERSLQQALTSRRRGEKWSECSSTTGQR